MYGQDAFKLWALPYCFGTRTKQAVVQLVKIEEREELLWNTIISTMLGFYSVRHKLQKTQQSVGGVCSGLSPGYWRVVQPSIIPHEMLPGHTTPCLRREGRRWCPDPKETTPNWSTCSTETTHLSWSTCLKGMSRVQWANLQQEVLIWQAKDEAWHWVGASPFHFAYNRGRRNIKLDSHRNHKPPDIRKKNWGLKCKSSRAKRNHKPPKRQNLDYGKLSWS